MISTGTRIAAIHAIRTIASPAFGEPPPSVPEINSPRITSAGSRRTAIHAACTITRPVGGVNAQPGDSTVSLVPNTSAPAWTRVPLRTRLDPR